MISLEPELQQYYSNLKLRADRLSLSSKFNDLKIAIGLYSEILRGVINYEKIDSAWVDSTVNGLVNKCADRLLKTADTYFNDPKIENLKISAKLYNMCLEIVETVSNADAQFNSNKNYKQINNLSRVSLNGINKCKQTYKNLYVPKKNKISRLIDRIFHKKDKNEENFDELKF